MQSNPQARHTLHRVSSTDEASPPARNGPMRWLALTAAVAVLFALPATQAMAQQRGVSASDAVVSSFSGLGTSRASGRQSIDLNAPVLRLLDLSRPDTPADGSVGRTEQEILAAAREIGQVFSLALDDGEPPAIYAAASSAYGLYRRPDNSGWMAGMWGPRGGPGSVYRLGPDNGYRPELFANIDLQGRANTGAGLGAIAFDPLGRQLYVSDLETGMIHRLDLETGETIETYDHGTEGRSYFYDAPSGRYRVLGVQPFDASTKARPDACGNGPARLAAERFMQNPDCWNFAPLKRRVWGLGVQVDAEQGTSRLFYATWGSAAFGDRQWADAGDDARNAIWSVGINEDGGFDLTSVRREAIMPAFFITRQDRAAFGESFPVTDIAFTPDGALLAAERPAFSNDAEASDPAMPATGGARVIRFAADEEGVWQAEGRYDIGFGLRRDQDPPYLRASSAGGLAVGYGYRNGRFDPRAYGQRLWATSDLLCSSAAPCGGNAASRTEAAAGLQGLPADTWAEVSPTEAFAPPRRAAERPADGPAASYMIALEGEDAPQRLGDIAIVAPPLAGQRLAEREPEPREPERREPERRPAPEPLAIAPPVDLALDVQASQDECAPGETCRFEVEVANDGRAPFEGPLAVSFQAGGGLQLRSASPRGWNCGGRGDEIDCVRPNVSLGVGESLDLSLAYRVPGDIAETPIRVCGSIGWLGLSGRHQVRAVQMGLIEAGFDPGPVDGIMGRRTAGAIRDAQTVFGLPRTGEISSELIVALFDEGADRSFDDDPRNDRACKDIAIDLPPAHRPELSAFHRQSPSRAHDARTSGPVEVHDPDLSMFHQRFRSAMHDERTTGRLPVHQQVLSLFHRRYSSEQHDGATSNRIRVHSRRLSLFHQRWESRLHEQATSRHVTGLSRFHSRADSRRHNPDTSGAGPVHRRRLSAFHETYESRFHEQGTSAHVTGLSRFHARNASRLHDPATSGREPVHRPRLSAFHDRFRSNLHETGTSAHRTGLSRFHMQEQSRLHVQGTSTVAPPPQPPAPEPPAPQPPAPEPPAPPPQNEPPQNQPPQSEPPPQNQPQPAPPQVEEGAVQPPPEPETPPFIPPR